MAGRAAGAGEQGLALQRLGIAGMAAGADPQEGVVVHQVPEVPLGDLGAGFVAAAGLGGAAIGAG